MAKKVAKKDADLKAFVVENLIKEKQALEKKLRTGVAFVDSFVDAMEAELEKRHKRGKETTIAMLSRQGWRFKDVTVTHACLIEEQTWAMHLYLRVLERRIEDLQRKPNTRKAK